MRSMEVLSALTNVRDSYVLESALPSVSRSAPASAFAIRRRRKDHSLGRMLSDGWVVAAVCTLVAIGTLSGLIWLGQNPPTSLIGNDGSTSTDPSEAPVTEGITTNALVYVSNGDGTCSVKAAESFGKDGKDVRLVIPEKSPLGDTVTRIADYGFLWKTELKSVTLPDTVTEIGQWAFAECTALEIVELPEGLISIGTAAFLECSSLGSVMLPEGLTTLGNSVFSTCTSLRRVTLPATLEVIPQWAFYNCVALTEITCKEGLREIGYSAFCGCTSLSTLSLPTTVSRILKGAFAGCTELRSVTLKQGLTEIGDLAFDGCSRLASITVPDSLMSIGHTAMRDCTALRILTYEGTRAQWRALVGEDDLMPHGASVHCTDGIVKY